MGKIHVRETLVRGILLIYRLFLFFNILIWLGGPLYVNSDVGGKQKNILVGIVSYGYKCGMQNMPGVYTRVSAYLEWIEDAMEFLQKN